MVIPIHLQKYIYTCKNEIQRSVGSKNRVETNGRTDTTDRFTFPANAVGNHCNLIECFDRRRLYPVRQTLRNKYFRTALHGTAVSKCNARM